MLRKFGQGDLTGVDQEDPQGLSKEAVRGADREWTKQDSEELADENLED